MTKKCGDCDHWWQINHQGLGEEIKGECRHESPGFSLENDDSAKWPVTEEVKWCGDFREKPCFESGAVPFPEFAKGYGCRKTVTESLEGLRNIRDLVYKNEVLEKENKILDKQVYTLYEKHKQTEKNQRELREYNVKLKKENEDRKALLKPRYQHVDPLPIIDDLRADLIRKDSVIEKQERENDRLKQINDNINNSKLRYLTEIKDLKKSFEYDQRELLAQENEKLKLKNFDLNQRIDFACLYIQPLRENYGKIKKPFQLGRISERQDIIKMLLDSGPGKFNLSEIISKIGARDDS